MQLVFVAAAVVVVLPYIRALSLRRSAATRTALPARIPESLPE